MKEHVPTLDDMPPIKKARKRVKKHHTTNKVPVEVSIRRQLSAELGDDEPSKDEKFSLLQKYGVTTPRIDRLVTKPNWMGVAEWKRKQNDWFKVTKGLVSPSQRPRFHAQDRKTLPMQRGGMRPYTTSSQRTVSLPLSVSVGENQSQETKPYRGQPSSSRPLRNYAGGQSKSSQEARRTVRGMSNQNRSFGDRP